MNFRVFYEKYSEKWKHGLNILEICSKTGKNTKNMKIYAFYIKYVN